MSQAPLDAARASGLVRAGEPLLVLVSGGGDSVCLLDVALRLDARVSALNVNYGLREGAEIEVNGRRVAERAAGRTLSDRDAEAVLVELGTPLRGRDRLLALMDVGALVCRPRDPQCDACPLRRRCATRGARADERSSLQPRYEGSFRQRRGRVMARLRAGGAVEARSLDADALASLVDDGLAVVDRDALARLP